MAGRDTGYGRPAPLRGLFKEINGADRLDARVPQICAYRPFRASLATFGALAWSGFRRYIAHRQATIAGSFTDIEAGLPACDGRRSTASSRRDVPPARAYRCSISSTAQVPGSSAW